MREFAAAAMRARASRRMVIFEFTVTKQEKFKSKELKVKYFEVKNGKRAVDISDSTFFTPNVFYLIHRMPGWPVAP